VKAVANAAGITLCIVYIVAILLGILTKDIFNILPMTLGHAGLLVYLLNSLSQLDASRMGSVKLFYKKIWDLFYLEYCLYPFI
jgi:hypothetical protein